MHRGLWAIGLLIAPLVHGQERLTFEVASIKPSKPGGRGYIIKPLPGGQTYLAERIQVKHVISLMYKIPESQISGGPDWIETDFYDIDAKAARPSSLDDLHIMFQNLLADEFNFKFHKEIKVGSVYALMVDKSGLKMKVNKTEQDFKIPITEGARGGAATGTRVPMSYLCWWLSELLQREERPVIDKTGLNENYDFTLSFAPELPPDAPKDMPPIISDRPRIFDALKAQLGLKLEQQKGPLEYYLIDHVERPAAN
jgi:uncharacterized protein (TIGR03435 family)